MIAARTVDLSSWLDVRARVEPPVVRPGSVVRLVVDVQIPEGCHVESHTPREPWLIPTVLEVDAAPGVEVGEVAYPPDEVRTFDWSPVALRIYRGTIELTVPVSVGRGSAPGMHTLRGRVRYQGCTEAICLMPAEQPFEVGLTVE